MPGSQLSGRGYNLKKFIRKDWRFPVRKGISSSGGINFFEHKNITFDTVSDDIFKVHEGSNQITG
ncbi:MAG: hypothetical protein GX226_05535 [Dehalococcoidales bacterium]|jgi:hypothetical protein|nr:hypothetical protein [Dehalococcoidales bacterium]